MRIIYTVSVGLFLLSLNVFGQNSTIPEPEYTGNVVFIDNGESKPLEKQKASTKAKAGASMYLVGLGKVKASNVVTGVRSPIRVPKRDSIQFIVRVFDNSVDPFELINIFKLEQNPSKNNRFIEISSAGSFSGVSSNDIAFIPFQAKKYGEKSFLVQIDKQLIPGEYAITLEGTRETFNMFGVE